MPPIALHMVLARQLAGSVPDVCLADAEGAYLIGATSPDIRVITRQDRRDTHFYDLDNFDHQDSVEAFLATYRHLVDPAALNAETRAFVAGYISHLVFDEQYIDEIYRRYFARHDELGGLIRANLMDRMLQFDLERTYREDGDTVLRIIEALACSVETIECGFIDHETLDRWRLVSLDVSERAMDWDRVRQMTSNHLRRSGIAEEHELSEFLDSLPGLLDATITLVTSDEIEAFMQRSVDAAAHAVERYLQCG